MLQRVLAHRADAMLDDDERVDYDTSDLTMSVNEPTSLIISDMFDAPLPVVSDTGGGGASVFDQSLEELTAALKAKRHVVLENVQRVQVPQPVLTVSRHTSAAINEQQQSAALMSKQPEPAATVTACALGTPSKEQAKQLKIIRAQASLAAVQRMQELNVQDTMAEERPAAFIRNKKASREYAKAKKRLLKAMTEPTAQAKAELLPAQSDATKQRKRQQDIADDNTSHIRKLTQAAAVGEQEQAAAVSIVRQQPQAVNLTSKNSTKRDRRAVPVLPAATIQPKSVAAGEAAAPETKHKRSKIIVIKLQPKQSVPTQTVQELRLQVRELQQALQDAQKAAAAVKQHSVEQQQIVVSLTAEATTQHEAEEAKEEPATAVKPKKQKVSKKAKAKAKAVKAQERLAAIQRMQDLSVQEAMADVSKATTVRETTVTNESQTAKKQLQQQKAMAELGAQAEREPAQAKLASLGKRKRQHDIRDYIVQLDASPSHAASERSPIDTGLDTTLSSRLIADPLDHPHRSVTPTLTQATSLPTAELTERLWVSQAAEYGCKWVLADPAHQKEIYCTTILSYTSYHYDAHYGGGGKCTAADCPARIVQQEVDGHHVRICADDCRRHLSICGWKREVQTCGGVTDSWEYSCLIHNAILYGSQVNYVLGPAQLVPLLGCYQLRCLDH